MRRPSAETREHVLQIARDLFYEHGIRATGVDRVAAAAGVAPTTLYRLFAGKDDLVAAYLEREATGYRAWFTGAVDAAGPDPRDRIVAAFDALVAQVRAPDCRGCPFQIGIAELADPTLPGHRVAVAVKEWTRERLGELAAAFAARRGIDPDGLGDQLVLVFEGAYAGVLTLDRDGPVLQARTLVERLLDTAGSA